MALDTGKSCSFTDAVRHKYLDSDDEEVTDLPSVESGLVIDIVIHGKPKDTSGEGAELGFLRNVVLCESSVTHAGIPPEGLKSLCPNVTDLDLSGNLLKCWSEVLSILAALPKLKYVNLARNTIQNTGGILNQWEHQLPLVENLVLNRTRVSWTDVESLTQLFPELKELHICQNDYESLHSQNLSGLHSIECLRMNENKLSRWEEIAILRGLPNLKSLILSGNPLKNIHYYCSSKQPKECVTSHENEYCSKEIEEICDSSELNNSSKEAPLEVCSCLVERIVEAAVASEEDQTDCDNRCGANAVKSGMGDTELDGMVTTGAECNRGKPLCSVEHSTTCDKSEQQKTDLEAGNVMAQQQKCTDNISQERAEIDPSLFAKLETLCLSGTDLSSSDHLDALSQFPSLKSLRIQDTKFFGDDLSPEDRWKLLVACLPNIKKLNGSEVTSSEREKCERHMLRYFHDQSQKPERYHDLEKQYGTVKPLTHIDIRRGYKEFVELSFIYQGSVVHVCDVHAAQPVGKLRTYVAQKILNLSSRTFKLFLYPSGPEHVFEHWETPELEELVCDSLPLSRYDVMDGDQIHIDKKIFKGKEKPVKLALDMLK